MNVSKINLSSQQNCSEENWFNRVQKLVSFRVPLGSGLLKNFRDLQISVHKLCVFFLSAKVNPAGVWLPKTCKDS